MSNRFTNLLLISRGDELWPGDLKISLNFVQLLAFLVMRRRFKFGGQSMKFMMVWAFVSVYRQKAKVRLVDLVGGQFFSCLKSLIKLRYLRSCIRSLVLQRLAAVPVWGIPVEDGFVYGY
jgi:hypothetical protein